MLRKIRIILAVTVFILITFLFLDFTGTLHLFFGWLAKIQLIPAILAVNIVALIFLVLLTIVFGRVYCSVICPLGIMQDGISNIASRRKGKKNRFSYSEAKNWLRYGILAIFIIVGIAGASLIVSLLDPYAAYGRIASNFFMPIYRLGNNLLAFFAERADSYAFYSTDVWIKSWLVFGAAVATFAAIGILAWRNGRTYCNTICPVGSILGLISKYSLVKLTFDADKCTNCKLCERSCKASCINSKDNKIDYSRCVACFNCIEACKPKGISYKLQPIGKKANIEASTISESTSAASTNNNGMSRRHVLSVVGTLAIGSTLKAQQLEVDGGLADIEDKKIPFRATPIVPPGALGLSNMKRHCTACLLCISACPNNVLRPSNKLATFMQPEMSFERGYCRPECIECSQVCPTGAITTITTADKSAISIGHAVWTEDNCIVNTDGVPCNNCERHCPTNAITFVPLNPAEESTPPQAPGFPGRRPPILKIPTINKELCIGCGACENLCPARPYSAIYIEGNVRHHTI